MIEDSITEGELINKLIPSVVPWIILFVISLFSIFSYCYCCCCSRCACCCNKKTGLSKVDLLWPLIGSLAFCFYVLVSSSVGLGKAGNFMQDYYMLKCSMFGFMADFITGNDDNKSAIFIGLSGIDNALGDIKDNFLGNV